jgi:ABC-type oligopeptide transport system substrate-binding subunit
LTPPVKDPTRARSSRAPDRLLPSTFRQLVAIATIGFAGACGGSSDLAEAPPVRLVTPSAARLAELAVVPPDPSQPTAPRPDLRAELATAAAFEAHLGACRRDLAAAVAAPAKGPIGAIHQGHVPPKLPPLPPDRIFRWVEVNPEFIDPNLVSESSGTSIVLNLFETLYVAAPDNSPPRPGAALRHDVSPDGLTWTFHLRPNMRWSDGTPVTAHDFVYGWRRGLDPTTGSKNAQLLWFIRGAADYNQGRTSDPNSVAIHAPDDLTLVVGLVGPTPFLDTLVTYTAFAPIPRHAVEKHGVAWTRPANIVTNGAFLLAEWHERDRFVLKKNPDFWDAANIALDGSIIFHSEEERRNENLYAAGQIHVARPLSQDSVRQWIRDGRADLRIDLNMCIYYYSLRMDRPPFSDARVRRAFNLALDKERLTRHILGAFQQVATTVVPAMVEPFSRYRPSPGPDFDPDRGAVLLATAGHPRGVALPPLEISYNTSEGHKRIAEFAARQWSETLGVPMTSANMEWKSLLKKQSAGDFQITRTAWCADYPDAMTFLEVFQSGSENNYAAYRNPAYDALLERARREPDPAERNALLCAAERGLVDDMPVVPMYQYTRATLIRPEVRGYLPQYQDLHLLRWLAIDHGAAATGGPR